MRLRYLCGFAAAIALAAGCSGDGPTPSGPEALNEGVRKPSLFASSTSDPSAGSAAFCAVASPAAALAKPVGDAGNPNFTVFSTDFVSAGVGGMRNLGYGTITLAGLTGPVSAAYLYWHGLTNSPTDVGDMITVNGSPVAGTNIGYSSDNCWGYQNSQAYRADVTALVAVTGNGDYDLDGFGAMNPNGASLIVFFNDGDPSNNRDAVIYEGNDSNIYFPGIVGNPLAPEDPEGWDVSLSGINYSAGTASIELHVADGQTFPDDALLVNASVIEPSGPVFDGNTVPGTDPDGPNDNGNLWDIRSWDVTSFLAPGPNTLNLTTGVFGDCLGLIVAIVDLPAGAAPNQPMSVDIKPTSCPNPLQIGGKGTLPVAILGTDGLDVTNIDPSTILLAGVAPEKWSIEDVATPLSADNAVGSDCLECTTDGPDGVDDLTLKFDKQAVTDALAAAGPLADGDCLVVELTAETYDGEALSGSDVVRIQIKGK